MTGQSLGRRNCPFCAEAIKLEAVKCPFCQEAVGKTEFSVELQEIGPNRINLIKAIREATTLGFEEALDLVESAPAMIKRAIIKEDAAQLLGKLEQAGAKVVVR